MTPEDKEKVLKSCIDSLFEMDRKIFEAEQAQKDIHLVIATMANPGEELLKKARNADDMIERMKTQRKFCSDVLFNATGAIVVSILDT